MKKEVKLFIGFVAILLCLFLYNHHRRNQPQIERNLIIQAKRRERVAQKNAEWGKGLFTSEDFSGAVAEAVAKTTNTVEKGTAAGQPKQIVLNQKLNAEQIEKLSEVTADFCKTFGNADINFEKYLAFKAASRHYKFNFGGIVGAIIVNCHVPIPSDADQMQKAKLFWDYSTSDYNNSRNGARPRITAIDLNTIKLWLYEGSNTNYATGALSLRLLNNMGKQAINTLISYDDSPGEIVRENGKFTYVAVSAICRFNTSPDPGPITIGLYWSEKERTWMPWELASDGSSGYYTVF